MMRCNNIF